MAILADGARHAPPRAAVLGGGGVPIAQAPIRAFVAILLDPMTRAALGSQLAELRRAAPSVSWVAPENVHLTMKFLGNVEPGLVEAVTAALQGAVAGEAPFELAIAGLGAFPTASRARVVWAGVSGGREPVCRLAARVDAALEPLGFVRESRPFSPHLTLGRVREPRRDERLEALIVQGVGRVFGGFRVTAVSLMRSVLAPGGARYSELAAAPLGP